MQSPSMNKASKQLHEISESAKDALEQNIPEFRNKIKGIASETTEHLTDAQHKAKSWVEDNYGKTLGVVGVIAAIGTIAYLLSKRNQAQEDIWSSKQAS